MVRFQIPNVFVFPLNISIFLILILKLFRRGIGGIPSSRLGLKSGRAGSLAAGATAGDDSSIQDGSSLDGEESEK